MFEDEKVGSALARDTNEAMIEIFDDSANHFIVAQLHADTGFNFDQMLEVLDLFERLFRRTRAARCSAGHLVLQAPFLLLMIDWRGLFGRRFTRCSYGFIRRRQRNA